MRCVNLKWLHKQGSARVLRWTREREIACVMQCITPYVRRRSSDLKVLEFGAGNCYQAKRLSTMGSITAMDTGFMGLDKASRVDKCVIAKMETSPFKANAFDVIFSNHVLEHLNDLPGALSEVKRISKSDALFAFSVPTRFWLIVAQPAEMGWRLSGLIKLWRREGVWDVGSVFKLTGHGEYHSFSEAFRAFGVTTWTTLLEANGFRVIKRVPLLAYAPSELLLPPSRTLVRLGLCSSMLFVLKRVTKLPSVK